MPKRSTKKLQTLNSVEQICSNCNPKKHLKFNFTFAKENGKPASSDSYNFLQKMQFLCSEQYLIMKYKYAGNKASFIEQIPTNIVNKQIPNEFRELYPAQTNEKYDVFRIYSAGTPSGSANPRIIGMIRNTIFYVFFIDWKGDLYSHGR